MDADPSSRVVVTGLGPVSSLGMGHEAFATGLQESPEMSSTRTEYSEDYRLALIDNFQVEDYLEKDKNYLDRNSQFAFAAFSLALEDADLDLEALAKDRVGILLGTALGGMETMKLYYQDYLKKGPKFVKPFLFPHTYANTAISLLCIDYGIEGYHASYASGFLASHQAVLQAADLIREGRADVLFAGGVESMSEPLFGMIQSTGWLAKQGDISIPMDTRSKGMVLGEGGGVLVLESLQHALHRKANILAEVMGSSMSSGSHDSILKSFQRSYEKSEIKKSEQGCVMLSANGISAFDEMEAKALSRFQEENNPIPGCIAIKSLLGETMGAAGALQISAAIIALKNGIHPKACRPESLPEELPVESWDLQSLKSNWMMISACDPGGSILAMVVKTFEA